MGIITARTNEAKLMDDALAVIYDGTKGSVDSDVGEWTIH